MSAAGAVLLAASCHKADTAQSAQQVMPVDVSVVTTDSLTLFKQYPGTLIANSKADVVAKVNGTLSAPLYNGGDLVHEGQALFTVITPTYANNLQSAEAQLATAVSNNKYAEEHYEAVSRAFQKNAVSQMEVSQALNNRDQSRAAVSSARAAVAEARKMVSYCTVRAPLTGHITVNELSKGAYVSGEMSPVKLATVYSDSKLIAIFTIEDASFLRMFNNHNNRDLIDYTKIPVSFPEDLPHKYTADLKYLAPSVNASTGTIEIQGIMENPHYELKPGMYCTVSLPFKVDPAAMLVRDASISTDQLGKFVYVVNDSNKVVYTPIEVGDLAPGDTMRVVTKGLKPGDRYVTSAMLKVRDGMTVNPVIKK